MKALCLIGILTIFLPGIIMNYEPTEAAPEPVIETAAEDVYSELDEEPGCSCFNEGMQYGVYSDDIDDIPEEVIAIIEKMERGNGIEWR